MADGSSLRWTALAGLSFGAVGAGLVAAFSVAPWSGAAWESRALALVALGVGAVGACCWLAVVERVGRWRLRRRGALAGALAGVFGPAGFVLAASLFGEALGGTAGPVERVGAALFVGLVNLLYVGWLALPLGTATGYLLGRRRETAPERRPL
ncbi:hypothetical protein [Halosimplex halophilum]|uniref:hypothetical protein n=1 Tax=Halosimplex halophilum TaxID=2559572 RepID=UPI00107FA105|nr:hypothetical protein [Halosimplex halophilum]